LAGEEVEPAVREIRRAVQEIHRLAGEARATVKKIDRVASSIELIATGASFASAATKLVSGSRDTLASVIAGVKEGLRTLRKPPADVSTSEKGEERHFEVGMAEEGGRGPEEPQESKEDVKSGGE